MDNGENMIPECETESVRQIAYEEGFHDGYSQAMSEIPEIVFCKDCKYFANGIHLNTCFNINGLIPDADWFCADGVRNDG